MSPWVIGLISVKSSQARFAIAHAPRRPSTAQIGGMGVLAAILAHAGDVAFDVTGIECRLVERRIEELDEPGIAADQPAVEVLHGLIHSPVRAGTGKDRPALRDGIDLALRIDRRSERRAVIEVRAAIPFAIPAVFFDIASQPCRLRACICQRWQRLHGGGQVPRIA